MRAALIAVSVLLAACAGVAAETTTTTTAGVQEGPATTMTSMSSTSAPEPDSTEAQPEVFEFSPDDAFELGEFQPLGAGQVYRMPLDALILEITPFDGHWALRPYPSWGGLDFRWDGPSGFRPSTLMVALHDVSQDGETAAWDRIEAILQGAAEKTGLPLTEEAHGTSLVAGADAEWREIRTPIEGPTTEWSMFLSRRWPIAIPDDTSVRYHVVPVSDFTVTVVAWEDRCNGCEVEEGMPDDFENELSMWISELEAFLASMTFEAP